MTQHRRLSAALTLSLATALAGGAVPSFAAAGGQLDVHVFDDTNANGVMDAAEEPIAGQLVELTDPAGAVVATGTTDATGLVTLTGLDGTYQLRTTAPASSRQTTPSAPLTVTASEGLDVTVGFAQVSTVSGRVTDGVNNAPLEEATVQALEAGTGVVKAQAYTLPDGTYTLADLLPGSYSIKVMQTGYTHQELPATLVGGAPATVDAALSREPGTVSGLVWDDRDRDGVRDAGEPGLAGARVTVRDTATSTGQSKSTTTGADGRYSLPVTAWSTYQVDFVAPQGFSTHVGSESVGAGTTVVVDGTALSPTASSGMVSDSPVLWGYVWDDRNADGVAQEGEGIVKGATVTIRDARGTVAATPTLDDEGYFEAELPAGTYTVDFAAPAGYFTQALGHSAGASTTVTLDENAPVAEVASGMLAAAGIDGSAWLDANSNRTREPGEAPLVGAEFTLTRDGKTLSTKSDAKGAFTFDNLMPGTYRATMTVPSSITNVQQRTVSADITLRPGERAPLPAWVENAADSKTSTSPGSSATSPKTTTQGSAVPASSRAGGTSQLANTGVEVGTPLTGATGLILAGLGLLVRRRRLG